MQPIVPVAPLVSELYAILYIFVKHYFTINERNFIAILISLHSKKNFTTLHSICCVEGSKIGLAGF